VLAAAIELRHAPYTVDQGSFRADPYFVLPILMTHHMVLQTRMNPVPPDPVQAKVMQFMPTFSASSFLLPPDCALWLVTTLSIAQQWQIHACSTATNCPCQR